MLSYSEAWCAVTVGANVTCGGEAGTIERIDEGRGEVGVRLASGALRWVDPRTLTF